MALGSPKAKQRSGCLPVKSRARRDASDAHEGEIAEIVGGKVQRGSGAVARHKGDVITDDFLIENKTRLEDAQDGAKSITIQGAWLSKISTEAIAKGRSPALAFRIPSMLGEKDWIAVPASVFARLREQANG